MNLHQYFERSAAQSAEACAIEQADGATISYAELAALSDRVRDRLMLEGVEAGDRVGLYLRKTIDTVASILGVLKAGAAYVPVDPTAPASRNGYIFDNCRVKAAIVESRFSEKLEAELQQPSGAPPLFVVDEAGGGRGLERMLDGLDERKPAPKSESREVPMSNLAYILYTSGSTGKPKGVMLTHENATSFVDWCLETFEPTADDVFSSHAPFHFDLSILDIYTPLSSGAKLVLVPEDVGKEPLGLAALIEEKRITVWYSAPSILTMLTQRGELEGRDYSSLRAVLFAGEVFPVVHLRSLHEKWPHTRYFNLYGPTETNVCTYYEVVPPIPEDRTEPYPIGAVCSQLEGIVVDLDDQPVEKGDEGELCIKGPNVLNGYWELPEQTANAFLADYYRTGDIVVEEDGGNFRFVGRRDRMVKKRGYRVELGEIETALYAHEEIEEAAVVAIPDDDAGVMIHAHLSTVSGDKVSMIKLKKFCSERLPVYMVPDRFAFHESLPKTSTDKIDYQGLKNG
ncbi:MAG: amino acid adenylation domain-containing protein [Myxococcota bacterium]|jgi:amino acid adenylation domain-containing protein|nr:amino acid adenylation domain-containing protein [Myxococcota bacterium]